MTKLKTIAIGFAATMLLSTTASAMLIYDVDRTIGGGSVTGTITTNGDFGLLDGSDIFDWDFLISAPGLGGSPVAVNSGNSDFIIDFGGSGITASATALTFDFDAADNGAYFGIAGGAAWCLFEDACFSTNGPGEAIFDGSNAVEFVGAMGTQVIATRVPAPGAIALLLMGLAGLIIGRRPRAV